MTTESIWSNVKRAESLPSGRLIHPRVLDVPGASGRTLVFVSYADIPSAHALFEAMRPAVESAWLAELSSQPFTEPTDETIPPIIAMELYCFGDLPERAADAVRAFGFAPVTQDLAAEDLVAEDDATKGHIPQLRGEASRVGLPVPENANAVFRARVRYTDASQTEDLATLTEGLRGETFGQDPGSLARALIRHFGSKSDLKADFHGLDTLEGRLFTQEPDVVRGVSPVLFPLFADLVGVCLQLELGVRVGWALSEADDQSLFQPALLQVEAEGAPPQVFPVGLELLRRCVMPRAADESIAPLSDWLRGGFAQNS